MAGYIRQSTFVDGDTITAALFNNEYNQLVNAFSNTSGHKHDGTTAEGPVIGLIGDAGETSPNNKVLIDTTNNYIEFYVEVSSAPVQQLYIADGAIIPVTDSDIDLGTTSLRFKDTYTDTVTTTGNVSIGGDLTVTGSATISGNLTFGDADTDSINLAAEIDSDIIPNTDGTYDLGSATKEWQDLYIDGTANIDSLVADTADINGGTIDGATIATSDITVGAGKTLNVSAGTLTLADDQISGDKVEGGTIAATTITTLTSTTGNITNVNATTVDSTNLEVTNLKAKDGTAAGSIADSTGVVTLASSVLTTTDINGGTIDGVTIGGSSAGAVTFTDLSDGTITIAGFADEDNMVSDSATLLPTQQSVKAYVDAQVTAQDLDFQGDTGGALSIDLDSESLTIAGGTGIDTSGATNTLTVAIDSTVATLTGTQTLTNKTLTSPDVNTPDIDGGTIDGTVIGGTTPAAGTFTTLTANTSITGTLATAAQPNITSVGTLTGLTTTGDINFGDNDKAVFGAGSDLQIYHDGSNSIIADSGTGSLLLRGSNVWIQNADGTETGARFITDGAIDLRYDNSVKLATTSTGIDVTGEIVGDGLDITDSASDIAFLRSSNATTSNVYITNTNATTGNTANLYLAPANNVAGSQISSIAIEDFSVSANRTADLAFSTRLNGTMSERMRIDSSGNVGINCSPSYPFHVTGNGDTVAAVTAGASSIAALNLGNSTNLADGGIRYDNSADALIFRASNAEKMRIDSSGNVGIGASTALDNKLEVNGGDIRVRGTSTPSLKLNNGNQEVVGMRLESGATGNLSFHTNKMVIDSSGNVGIGTTSPSEALEVDGNIQIKYTGVNVDPDGARYLYFNNTDTTLVAGQPLGGISFINNDATATAGEAAYIKAYATTNTGSTELRFGTGTQNSPSEAMRIDSSGNVLVGTTQNNPTSSGVNVAGQEFSTTGGVRSTVASNPAATFNRKTDDGAIALFRKDGSTVGSIGVVSGDRMYFSTADGLGLQLDYDNNRIIPCDASGAYNNNVELGDSSLEFTNLWLSNNAYIGNNVGINTTSPAKQLHVYQPSGQTGILLSRSDNITGVNLQLSVDSTKTRLLSYGDGLSFWTAATGSGTNASERMRIDSSGRLLVGTTSTTPAFGTNTGIALVPTGESMLSANSTTTLFLNRTTSDGSILDFRKNGTQVGSIGTQSGTDFYITGSTAVATGLRFQANEIVAVNGSAGNRDAAIDIGKSNIRFKDLYLSGGAYLGGTGSANHLDDYEEGTWTPELRNNATALTQSWLYRTGTYTKVGRAVHVHWGGKLSSLSGTGSGALRIYGLPFASATTGGFQEPAENLFLGNQTTAEDSYTVYAFIGNSNSYLECRELTGGDDVFESNKIDGDTFFKFQMTYYV